MKTDAELLYDNAGTPPDRASETKHPLDDVAPTFYPEPTMSPRERNLEALFHEEMAVKIGWNGERRLTEARDSIATVTGAGLDPDSDLPKLFLGGVVSAEIGTTIDPAITRQRLQDFRAEQQALRTPAGYEQLQSRVNRWLATQPRLSKLIERARVQHSPELLSILFDHVHSQNLGRA